MSLSRMEPERSTTNIIAMGGRTSGLRPRTTVWTTKRGSLGSAAHAARAPSTLMPAAWGAGSATASG
ncbi:MAG: hypothetical protein SangKO_005640 [Sandaracinaceae bacterium]